MSEPEVRNNRDGSIVEWSWTRLLGLVLILLAAIVAVYLVVAYVGWQQGEAIRVETVETARSQQMERQVELAREDIGTASYNLALARLEWVLERDPENADARALQRQAAAALRTASAPEARPTPTVAVEPTPLPAVEGDGVTNADTAELERLQRLGRQEQWEEVIAGTLAFQRQLPAYERSETDRLLYTAYLNRGLELVRGEQVEAGIYYFSQAEKLGDLPQEALDYWLWAELYLQGIAYYGVNWGVAVSFFRDLCLAAPFFQGACEKLYDSLIAYGDQYAAGGEWCPAAELYREARQYGNNQALGTKLSAATEGCAAATPTPEVISDTLTITDTLPLESPPPNE